MLRRVKKSVGIVVILGVSLLGGLFVFNRQQGIFLGETLEVPSITPIPKPTISGEATSIDGTKKLTMRTLKKEEDMVSYTFLITDEKEYSIFSTDAKENAFVVPSNSWSPDTRHVFLIDTTSLPEQILVFNASGEPFADGKHFLNVTELFVAKGFVYIVDTATGWDSRGLLHIRTKNQDDSKGPSFWFDVDSRSFIQLAAR